MDDDGLVVGGKGVGEVGDDDQDGGRQEGGQQAARQRPRKLKDHLETRQTLNCCNASEYQNLCLPQKWNGTF